MGREQGYGREGNFRPTQLLFVCGQSTKRWEYPRESPRIPRWSSARLPQTCSTAAPQPPRRTGPERSDNPTSGKVAEPQALSVAAQTPYWSQPCKTATRQKSSAKTVRGSCPQTAEGRSTTPIAQAARRQVYETADAPPPSL